jgi:hypothetical protein
MTTIRKYATGVLLLAVGMFAQLRAQQPADSKSNDLDPAATEALRKMGMLLRSLKSFEVQADVTSELVLDDGQKLQFAQKANILARTPDRLVADIDGDLKKRLYVYDGKAFTLFAIRAGYYATTAAPPTIAQLIDVLEDKYGVEIPLADLFLWGGPKAPTDRITSALEVGSGQVGGVPCGHYAFRQPGMDWQIWIQRGDNPLPRKIVLTTTTDQARPQHTSVLTWNLAPAFNDAAFQFQPPPGVDKITFAEDKVLAGKQ